MSSRGELLATSICSKAKPGAVNQGWAWGGPFQGGQARGLPQPWEGETITSSLLLLRQAWASASGNTLGTQLTGVSPLELPEQQLPMRRCRDAACGFHHRFIRGLEQSQILCSVGANCSPATLQPFFSPPPCLAACQTEIQGCYRMAQLPKPRALPFSRELVGDNQTTRGRNFQFLEHIEKSTLATFLWQKCIDNENV